MNTILPDAYLLMKTVLLAEDDIDDQDFIKEAFLSINKRLHLQTVAKGNKVLPFLENLSDSQLPQLIVLDYNLPEMDGAEVLKLLAQHSRYQEIPKIIWSTSNSPHYKTRSLELGAASYMVKPSDIKGIENMARQMLESCQLAV